MYLYIEYIQDTDFMLLETRILVMNYTNSLHMILLVTSSILNLCGVSELMNGLQAMHASRY